MGEIIIRSYKEWTFASIHTKILTQIQAFEVFEANIVKNEVEVIIDMEVSKFPMRSLRLLMFTLSLGSRIGLGTFQHLTFWQETFQHRHSLIAALIKSPW